MSQEFIYILGTKLSLDEMMIRFFGRSCETHRMKNKPIKEGYKFFVLTTKTDDVVVNFTSNDRRERLNWDSKSILKINHWGR